MELEAIKTHRLYIKVADQISELVRQGDVKVGDKLPSERDLAEKLGVSRPVIREAMIALELSGIVEIRTGSGIYIIDKKMKLDIIDNGVGPFEILDARYIIEAEACSLAAARITEQQIQQLRDVIVEMEEEEKKPNAAERADMKFHLLIADACQNSAISSMVKWLWELRNQSQLSKVLMDKIRKEGVHPSINEHRKIVDALANRNPEKARNAMKTHIENSTESALNYFSNKAV